MLQPAVQRLWEFTEGAHLPACHVRKYIWLSSSALNLTHHINLDIFIFAVLLRRNKPTENLCRKLRKDENNCRCEGYGMKNMALLL